MIRQILGDVARAGERISHAAGRANEVVNALDEAVSALSSGSRALREIAGRMAEANALYHLDLERNWTYPDTPGCEPAPVYKAHTAEYLGRLRALGGDK